MAIKNFAKAKLAYAYGASETVLQVAAGLGTRFPAPPFTAALWNVSDYPDPSDDPYRELVTVTAVSGDVVTVVRGVGDDPASAKNLTGKTYVIAQTISKETLEENGDVTGPVSSVSGNVATFNGTSGKVLGDGGATVAQIRDRATHTGAQAIATVTGLQSAIDAKEASIAAGTTAQYWRGDKIWQTLDKSAVGLSNVDNTTDAGKPVSTAQQTALNGKEGTISAGTTSQYWRGDKTWQTLNKAAVSLGSVDNTSDVDKPVSTAQQTALNGKANTSHTHAQSDVTNLTTDLAAKEPTISVGTTVQYWRGDKSWQTLDKSAVGLGNVDNTSDASKPMSDAVALALPINIPFGIRRCRLGEATGSTVTGYGFSTATFGTSSNIAATGTTPGFVRYATGATNGNNAGINGSNSANDAVATATNFDARFVVQLGQTTEQRVFVGLSTSAFGTMLGSDTVPVESVVFRASTSVPDSNWIFVTRGAGSEQSTDTGVAIGTGIVAFRIVESGSNIKAYINGTLVATHTTLPSAAQMLIPRISIRTLAAVDKWIQWSRMGFFSDF